MNEANNFLENKRVGNIVSLPKGKFYPHSLELEESVLGAILIDTKSLDIVINILQPDVFYKDAHKKIFTAILETYEKSNPIDLNTISEQLKKTGNLDLVGGNYYLIQLTQKIISSANIEFHSKIIQQKFIQRKFIDISHELLNISSNEEIDVKDLIDIAEQKFYEISQGVTKESIKEISTLIMDAKKVIEKTGKEEGINGVPSGFNEIDMTTIGWQPSDLIIIAARPGMGKTSFTLSMAKNITVNHNIPVVFFSLEMSAMQLIMRLISSETDLSSEKLRNGNLEDHEWAILNNKITNLENAPLYIDDTPALSIFDLRSKTRRLVSQYKVKLIIIDYLQLMTGSNSVKNFNREQEIAHISRSLKGLAKEINIPIIAISQLSRAVETRGGTKRPLLSDLRESGAIEQDADIVSFIYRPEYYGIEQWDDDDRTSCIDQAEFIISKHRNGQLKSIKLSFLKKLGKFEDINQTNVYYNSKMNEEESKNIPNVDAKTAFGNDGDDKPPF